MDNLKSFTPDYRNLKSLSNLSYTPNAQGTILFRKSTLPNLSTKHKKSRSEINHKILPIQQEVPENIEIYKKAIPKVQGRSTPRGISEINLKKLAILSPHESPFSSIRLRDSAFTTSREFEQGTYQTERVHRNEFPLFTARGPNVDSNDFSYIKQEEYIKNNPHFKKFHKSLHLIDKKEAVRIGFSKEFFWSDFQVEYNKQMSRVRENSRGDSQMKSTHFHLFEN